MQRGTAPARLLIVPVAVVLAVGLVWGLGKVRNRIRNSFRPAPAATTRIPEQPVVGGSPPMPPQVTRPEVAEVQVDVVARDLQIVWAITFAPDGRLFFTERPGRIGLIRTPGASPERYLALDAVVHNGESGLMGLTLHPNFPRVPYLYVMYTAAKQGGAVNRISRLTDRGETATDEEVLLDDIPASRNHDGGALSFGPDGMLYAGTGDAAVPALSQDLGSPCGKILRLTPDGKVPPDNPFPNSPVYAYGFRNVTGLSWHPGTRELWAASHGPSDITPPVQHRDSVYIVRKGGNHGWPLIMGASPEPEIVDPVLYYPDAAVPPGGSLFYTGALFPRFRGNYFLTSLRAEQLHRVIVRGASRIAAIERWWPNRFGRLRAIGQGLDGAIYVGTSNRDGRTEGSYPGSDYIYRITPKEQP
jgi:aldose sugar dehydrogenase